MDTSTGASSAGGGGSGAAALAGKKHFVFPDSNAVVEFFKNMSRAGDRFDQISYHKNSGVVLRGMVNNSACRSIGNGLPTSMTACFTHHWLEFHVTNSNLPARTLVNCTDLQFVQLHFMDMGFGWQFRNTSA